MTKKYHILNITLGCYVMREDRGDERFIFPLKHHPSWTLEHLVDFWRVEKEASSEFSESWIDIHDGCQPNEFQLVPIEDEEESL